MRWRDYATGADPPNGPPDDWRPPNDEWLRFVTRITSAPETPLLADARIGAYQWSRERS